MPRWSSLDFPKKEKSLLLSHLDSSSRSPRRLSRYERYKSCIKIAQNTVVNLWKSYLPKSPVDCETSSVEDLEGNCQFLRTAQRWRVESHALRGVGRLTQLRQFTDGSVAQTGRSTKAAPQQYIPVRVMAIQWQCFVINLGRKTAYSLMGAGFHSVNGLKTCLNGHLWSTYIVPRLVYGLEILSLKKQDIDNLEKFQRKSLRQLQGLPDKTSNSITLALLGILPLESIIHKNSLNLFVNIARNHHFIKYEIAERQLVMKGCEEKSWFNLIKSILETYNLPSIFHYLVNKVPSLNGRKL